MMLNLIGTFTSNEIAMSCMNRSPSSFLLVVVFGTLNQNYRREFTSSSFLSSSCSSEVAASREVHSVQAIESELNHTILQSHPDLSGVEVSFFRYSFSNFSKSPFKVWVIHRYILYIVPTYNHIQNWKRFIINTLLVSIREGGPNARDTERIPETNYTKRGGEESSTPRTAISFSGLYNFAQYTFLSMCVHTYQQSHPTYPWILFHYNFKCS